MCEHGASENNKMLNCKTNNSRIRLHSFDFLANKEMNIRLIIVIEATWECDFKSIDCLSSASIVQCKSS